MLAGLGKSLDEARPGGLVVGVDYERYQAQAVEHGAVLLVPPLETELDGAGGDADQHGSRVIALGQLVLDAGGLESGPTQPDIAAGEQDEVRAIEEGQVFGRGLGGDVTAVADADL